MMIRTLFVFFGYIFIFTMYLIAAAFTLFFSLLKRILGIQPAPGEKSRQGSQSGALAASFEKTVNSYTKAHTRKKKSHSFLAGFLIGFGNGARKWFK